MDSSTIEELIAGIKKIGDEIISWRNDESLKKVREPKEFKTEADFKASSLLKELIRKIDNTAHIISEEDDEFEENRPNAYWLIDPIDGTASWYEGFSGFVTQAAYIENECPVLGIVYAPGLKQMWWGAVGKGAFLNGKPIPKRNVYDFTNGFKLIDNYPEPARIAKTICEGFNVSEYIESGSLGLKSVLIADGTADVFVKDVVIRDWDIAPAHVILKELGCHLSDLDGEEIVFLNTHEKNNGLLVAATSDLALSVVEFIKSKRELDND